MKHSNTMALPPRGVSEPAEKFSVSIPAYLFQWGEKERRELHLNRSQFVAYLYQRFLEEDEHKERLARYAVAYAQVPESAAERALSDAFVQAVGD